MATQVLTPIELPLLARQLTQEFNGIIVGTGRTPDEQSKNFFSKAVAAYVLVHEAGATHQDAADASIDGGQDHGVDSVYITPDNTIWLIQSKYIEAGRGEPVLGDVSKFGGGVTDLINGQFARFNQALAAKIPALRQALGREECLVKVVLAYTGTAINEDRRQIFSDIERAFNGTNPGFVEFRVRGLTTLHDMQLAALLEEPIVAEIELDDYGYVPGPYRAFYGRLAAKSLAVLGLDHTDALVERNIRKFKGSSEVNDSMSATLENESQHFFYFNNGVTFLCDSMSEIGPRDPQRQRGRFRARGISIINGAQTVGAIAKKGVAHYETHPAEVLATFVCLENTPDEFGERVTQYRNRQNAVDLQDFAALDDNQSAWRQTLQMMDIEYIFKHGDNDGPLSENVFDIREAAAALACNQERDDWADYVIAAKTDRKKLFRKSKTGPGGVSIDGEYKHLFTDALTAREIWRSVQISRLVRTTIKARAAGESPGAREILQQGAWFALSMVALKTKLREAASFTLTAQEVQRISLAVDTIANQLVLSVESQQWGKQIRSVFESKTDCQTLKRLVLAAIPQQL